MHQHNNTAFLFDMWYHANYGWIKILRRKGLEGGKKKVNRLLCSQPSLHTSQAQRLYRWSQNLRRRVHPADTGDSHWRSRGTSCSTSFSRYISVCIALLFFLRYSLYVSGINTLMAAELLMPPFNGSAKKDTGPDAFHIRDASPLWTWWLCPSQCHSSWLIHDQSSSSSIPAPFESTHWVSLAKKNGTDVKARSDPIFLPPLQGGLFFPRTLVTTQKSLGNHEKHKPGAGIQLAAITFCSPA